MNGSPIKIKRLTDNKVYSSLQDAVRDNHLSKSALVRHTLKGKTIFKCGGIQWQVLGGARQ